MAALNETERVQFGEWTLRVHRATTLPPRLMLLIHGFTGDENSMWIFGRHLPARYWLVAPRAPHRARPSGYSWRPPRPAEEEGKRIEGFRPAVESVVRLADAFAAEHGIDGGTFDVLGFSQGAALAAALAVMFPDRIERVGILAGFVPQGADALLSDNQLTGKRFFVAHGAQDEMVSVSEARQAVSILEEAGAHVTFCTDEVGHKVSAGCLRGLAAFFA